MTDWTLVQLYSHALFTLTERVKYFTKKGSKVYCSFLDASKTFHKILHNGLFSKLLKRRAPVVLVRLLQNCYSHMQCCVEWNDTTGDTFPILCGVRVLSPYICLRYMLTIWLHIIKAVWSWFTCWAVVHSLCPVRSWYCANYYYSLLRQLAATQHTQPIQQSQKTYIKTKLKQDKTHYSIWKAVQHNKSYNTRKLKKY